MLETESKLSSALPLLKDKHNPVLGFDFGTRRIGVAVGQWVTKTAQALKTITYLKSQPDWKNITLLIKTWRPQALVVGLPLNMDGTEQEITVLAREFAENLTILYQLPVYTVDERLTTVSARERIFEQGGYRALRKTEMDGIAAVIILEAWLQQFP